jgi:hypothetical protein
MGGPTQKEQNMAIPVNMFNANTSEAAMAEMTQPLRATTL